MSLLSQPLALRGVTLPNRIMVSPMCTYSTSGDGIATDWHFAHYGRLAMGGETAEAGVTRVTPASTAI
mgnify:CR=1 FL=1